MTGQKSAALVVTAVIGIAIGVGAGLVVGSQKATALTEITRITLPSTYQQLSPVVPLMGAHWADPTNMPLGPIILLSEDNKLLGVEYMYTIDMFENKEIEGTPYQELAGLRVTIPELGIEKTVDHVDISFGSHEGFTEGHWDIHIYFVSAEELTVLAPPPAA